MNKNTRRFSLFPKTLSQVIEPLTRPVFKTQGLAGSKLLTEWAQVVGPELAARSTPLKLAFATGKTTGGTLTIAVENGFATEIQHMEPVILERLATYFGYKAVARITISHAQNTAKPAVPAPRAKTAPLPEASARLADEVEDEELKKALKSLAHTLSEPKN